MGSELIQFRYSVPSAAAGNAEAQPSPNASLGGYVSTSIFSGTAVGNLFDNQMTTDQLEGTPDYRCLFACNFNGTLDFNAAIAYLPSTQPTQSSVALGLDPVTAVAVDSASAQAATVASETTAPAGVSFSTPTTAETALPIGDLAPNTARAVWLRRTPTGVAAAENEQIVVRLSGTLSAAD